MNELSFKNTSVLNKSLSNSFTNLNTSHFNSNNDSKAIRKDQLSSSKLSSASIKKKTNHLNNEIHAKPFYPPSIHNSSKNLKKSIADSNLVPYENERATLFSTWTPLSDEKSNQKVKENYSNFNIYKFKNIFSLLIVV